MKEIEIPEGYEARIEGNKVIIELKESEDERIRKNLIELLLDTPAQDMISHHLELSKILSYLEKQKEQKPAEQLDGTFTSYDMAKTFMEGQNYVIAHPEKFGLCKPAECSEEDDALLKDIVSFFKDGTVKLQHDLNLYAGFLEKKFKSLRPQPHWKPSEEQMKALEDAFRKDGGNEYRKVINSLYCDLQKLL